MSMSLPSCNGAMPSSSPFFPPNFILQMQNSNSGHEHLLTPHDFSSRGAGMVSDTCEAEEELSDDCSQPGEKKRRLSIEQVRTLEKNFELGNKLEPERKLHLARSLGLQPRQIAIWFQNRRARWKTKQLEKDYDSLKRQFDAIKAENDDLRLNNKKLHAEIMAFRGREVTELINLNKETEGSSSNRSDNSSEINLDISRASATATDPAGVHLNHHLQSIPFFSVIRQPAITKIEHAADENFSNLLCGIDDQNAFWPWPDNQNLH